MVKVRTLREKIVKVEFPIDDDVIVLETLPYAVSAKEQAEYEMLEPESSQEQARLMAEMFCRYVRGWNLEDDDSNPLPVDVESVSMLPILLVQEMTEAVRAQGKG